MPLYEYYALGKDGKRYHDVIEARDLRDAFRKLTKVGLTVINIREKERKRKKEKKEEVKKEVVRSPRVGKEGKSILEIELNLPFGGGLSSQDLSVLSKQLGALVESGIGIVDALELVADAIDNKYLKKELPKIAEEVRGGKSLSKALSKRKSKFGELFVSMVEVGEETGQLDRVFKELSEYYKGIAEIINKIKSASYYPAFVLFSSSSITFGIIYFLVPTFAQIYSSMGGHLPALTQMLVNASNWLQANIIQFFIGLALFIAIFYLLYKKVYAFKKLIHRIQLSIPLFGPLFVKSAIAKLSRTFSTLFASGVSVERALELSAKVAGNTVYQEAIENVKKDVLKGEPIWQAFQKTKRFPKMFIAMVKIGEETGQLDSMLDSLADFYEDEVKTTIDGLISMIEPMMMVAIGGIVGFILIALYLPIFKMGELISGG